MADIVVERQTVISFPDSNIPDITEGIMEGSLHVSEILLSKHIAFGELNSNMFEVELQYDSDLSGKKIYVYQNIGTSVIPIFTGYIQSSRLDDYGEYRKVVAYDWFYKNGSQDATAWWNAFWDANDSSTLGVLLRNFLLYFSIPYVDKTLLNDNMTVTKTQDFTSIRVEDMLSLLCEANLCNPNFNRSGYLEFVTIYNASTKSIIDNYEWNNSKFEDYEITTIGLVQIYNSDGHIAVTIGSGTNCLRIKDNPFFFDKSTSELTTIATTIYNTVSSIQYMPADIKMILSDTSIHVGDLVTSSKGTSLVCEIEMSGPLLIEETLRSVGEEVVAEADSYDPKESRIQKVQKQTTAVGQSVSVLNSQVQELFKRVTNRYLLPFGMVLDEVTDLDDGGTPNNVLMFRYSSNSDNNSLTVHAELNFNVHTFEKEIDNIDCFQDALVTVAVILDETNRLVDFVEYLRDGWHVLNLDYLIGSAPSGTHDIYVAIQSQGASLYSMKVVSGYINALGTAASGPKQFYNIADMSTWIQTIANFCIDNFVGDVNILTVTTQSNWNWYERIYRQIRVDPFGTYRVTFDVQVVEDFVNDRHSQTDNLVRFQVGFRVPSTYNYKNDLWTQSDPFPTQASDSFVSMEVTYNNNEYGQQTNQAFGVNYLIFNFSGMPVSSSGKFNIRNLSIIKTNSDLQLIDWESNLYVWNFKGQVSNLVYFKTTGTLDAVILRGCGGTHDSYAFVTRIFSVIISKEEVNIDNYIAEYCAYGVVDYADAQIEFKNSITLSNGRVVYAYARKYAIASASVDAMQSFYSTTLNSPEANALGGSYDVYTMDEDKTHYNISYELDDYLCEKWGEPV